MYICDELLDIIIDYIEIKPMKFKEWFDFNKYEKIIDVNVDNVLYIKNNSIFIKRMFLNRPMKINWIKQIWPLHWRVGMTSVSSFFFTQTFEKPFFFTKPLHMFTQLA